MTHQYADGLRDIVYDVIRILCKLWIAADRKALEAADHRQIIEAVSDGSDAVIHDAEMAAAQSSACALSTPRALMSMHSQLTAAWT